MIPRTLTFLFEELKAALLASSKNSYINTTTAGIVQTYKIQLTFTEIYKDTIYDLLPPSSFHSDESFGSSATINRQKGAKQVNALPVVQILESPSDDGTGQLVLRNINVYEPRNEEEALSLYFLGMKNRNTSTTSMNVNSSRSHAIFTLIVETQSLRGVKTLFTKGKINLVDLAGSERSYKVSKICNF